MPETDLKPAFVCACEDWMRSACIGEIFYKEHKGKPYCVLHFPGLEKKAAFNEVLKRKLRVKDYNFTGVWFPEELNFNKFVFDRRVDFRAATFNEPVCFSAIFSANVVFNSAVFKARAVFFNVIFTEETNFNSTVFRAVADFSGAKFSGRCSFISATFRAQATFYAATFNSEANFSSAIFNARVAFRLTTFNSWAIFRSTTFRDSVRFGGGRTRLVFSDATLLEFQLAKIEKPELFSFYAVTLFPHWFINVDSRKFELIDVIWPWRSISVSREVKKLKGWGSLSPHRLLAIACRNLAINAEESHRYEEASRFRYMAMDARRQEIWRGGWRSSKKMPARLYRSLSRNWGARGRTHARLMRSLKAYWRNLDLIHWLYWVASGYGERVVRAFIILLIMWALFAILYTRVGFVRPELKTPSIDIAVVARDEVGAPLLYSRALVYSLGVIALQKPEPRPLTTIAQGLVLLETILGPIQAALLALAIRRRFMR